MKVVLCAIIGLAMAAQGLLAENAALDGARELAAEGRHGDALRAVDRVLADDPELAEALFLRGVVLAGAGREKEAQEVFIDLTRRYPQYPEPFNNLAVLIARGGDYERSVKVLKRALQTHSSYGTAYDNLTKVYGKLASRAYDRALGQESSAPSAGPALELLADLDASAAGFGSPSAITAAREERPEAVAGGTLSEPAPKIVVAEPVAPVMPSEPIVEFDAAGVVTMVKAWARAWSEQREDDYIGFYSRSFIPDGGSSRAAWAAQRREGIRGSRFIEVTVGSIGVRRTGDRQAQARFDQSYRSDRFSDRVSKTLDLVWEAGGWKIRGEGSRAN